MQRHGSSIGIDLLFSIILVFLFQIIFTKRIIARYLRKVNKKLPTFHRKLFIVSLIFRRKGNGYLCTDAHFAFKCDISSVICGDMLYNG